jgi:hypothetical protein
MLSMAPLIVTAARAETKRVRKVIALPLLGSRLAADRRAYGAVQQIVQMRRSQRLLHEKQRTHASAMRVLHRGANEKALRIAPERPSN